MNFINDSDFDTAFKKKVDDTDLLFEEEAWEKMEQKLKKRSRALFFSNTVAVLLLFCLGLSGFYFLNKNDKKINEYGVVKNPFTGKKNQLELVKEKLPSKSDVQNLVRGNFSRKTESTIMNIPLKNNYKHVHENPITHKKLDASDAQKPSAKLAASKANNSDDPINTKALKNPVQEIIANKSEEGIGEGLPIKNTNSIAQNNKPNNELSVSPINPNNVKGETSAKKITSKKGIPLTFAFNVGPDFNYTEAFEGGKTTLAGGLTIGAKITPKLSLKTGVLFGLKNYAASAYSYQLKNSARSSAITGIYANCDVLEIPLKASYTVYNDNKRSIDINTGLSSYLMLKEKYNFQYTAQSGYRDYTLVKSNANQHYLSVANISATYYIKLKNSKYQFGIEPYIKIPLQGVGEGKVHLKSSGLSLNLRYDFNTKNN